jgi:hypothetical protein
MNEDEDEDGMNKMGRGELEYSNELFEWMDAEKVKGIFPDYVRVKNCAMSQNILIWSKRSHWEMRKHDLHHRIIFLMPKMALMKIYLGSIEGNQLGLRGNKKHWNEEWGESYILECWAGMEQPAATSTVN